MNCRGCGNPLHDEDALCDLGAQPLANGLLSKAQLDEPETYYPLRPLVCRSCLLVQLPPLPREGIFTDDYPFFSGQSATWLAHCKRYADEAISRHDLGPTSRVLEIGSNDGSMLRRFRGRGIPALGVEPCASVAQHALMEGLPTIQGFWGVECAERLQATAGVPTGKTWRADLVIANNVLAHVPDLRDFLDGVRMILAPGGTLSFEVAYVGSTIAGEQFDQIYAEHYSYFSLRSLEAALVRSGLRPVEVEFLPTHGGSVRMWADASGAHDDGLSEGPFRDEALAGLHDLPTYREFADVPPRAKARIWKALLGHDGKLVAGYGAPAKATTFLNYCGVGREQIAFIADTTPAKWGKYLPGARIPIITPGQMAEAQPDVVVLLAWNWEAEALPKIRKACPKADVLILQGPRRGLHTARALQAVA